MTKKRDAPPEGASVSAVKVHADGAAAAGGRLGWTGSLGEHGHPAMRLAPREPVTSLRYAGRDLAPLLLPGAHARFTIGAGACDLIVPRAVSKNVSGVHAVLERIGSALQVRDQGSKNGTSRSRKEGRRESFVVQAGESFWLGDLQVLPMDAQLDALRPSVGWCVGLERDDGIDAAVETIAEGGPLALIGPAGSDAAWLAKAIHDTSARRENFFLSVVAKPLPSLEQAYGGTVFIDLDRVKKLPARYAETLFAEGRGLRPIFAARDNAVVRDHLDEYSHRVRLVKLVPLAERRQEVARLLAQDWSRERRTTRQVEELGPGLAALANHDWAGGVEELRDQSPRLLAYAEHKALRPAAAALGIKHQTLGAHFQRIGFVIRDWAKRA